MPFLHRGLGLIGPMRPRVSCHWLTEVFRSGCAFPGRRTSSDRRLDMGAGQRNADGAGVGSPGRECSRPPALVGTRFSPRAGLTRRGAVAAAYLCSAAGVHQLTRGQCGARIWAIGAARHAAVSAVRRRLGTSVDTRADYCFDQGASTRRQAPDARLWRRAGRSASWSRDLLRVGRGTTVSGWAPSQIS